MFLRSVGTQLRFRTSAAVAVEPDAERWCTSYVTRALVLIGCGAVAMALASGAGAAAPRYILVSGPGLEAPILLPDWGENLDLLVSMGNAPRIEPSTAGLSGRRRLRLSLFWGWPESPIPTDPWDANQTGWFYPRTGSQPGVVELDVPRVAPTRAMRILARHGVPTGPTGRSTQGDEVPCRAGEVRELVAYFLQAFNRGELRALDDAFAVEPLFRWYSTDGPGARLRAAAYDRRSLVAYFSGRRVSGETLRLRSLRFTGNANDGTRPYGNFTFALTRTNRKAGSAPYNGKGAMLCYERRPDVLIVWSMAARR